MELSDGLKSSEILQQGTMHILLEVTHQVGDYTLLTSIW